MESQKYDQKPFQDSLVIFRPYNIETDPEKFVIYIFDKMNTEDGLKALRSSDARFKSRGNLEVRFVAEFNGELIASLLLNTEYWNKEGYHMYAVVTAPQFRGSGISQMLFQYVCKWVSQQGKKLITVDTSGDNLRAQGFFKKIGFKQFGLIPQIIEKENDPLVDHVFFYYVIPSQ